MGRHIERQIPQVMPSAAAVAAKTSGMAKPFQVVGCRGTKNADNKQPEFTVHGQLRKAPNVFSSLEEKHVYVFVHGYNVTIDEALTSAKDLFEKLHAALKQDGLPSTELEFVLFTWPGDTGTIHFNAAQEYGQISGGALFQLIETIAGSAKRPKSLTLISHSLGAHVVLRSLSILGERNFHRALQYRVGAALLLGAAVKDDVFDRPERAEEYHFAEAAFGLRSLHIVSSRSDDVLGNAFFLNEQDKALGFSGPESMSSLASLARRVGEVLGDGEKFSFELHDFSPRSPTIFNPQLHVDSHGGYWRTQRQLNYYANLVAR